ncbi:cbb3-type cytochrome oxidase assembly protein CcoS [Moraxella haemolytica]|uniref:cbb3-type cytochrome oxidase assembly protein CcoS n=1 Tax=Moraxella TaxID=475 RepID=UPI0025432BC2|nr:cbb3-type cytochrome oxidase assembly protein CcoS [Moraxella sp. ZY171148]WII95698.1 cbb3-type cytochrome oxidase assembly protein CcoS [Moraxella sp. ZY171148]
MPSIYLLIPLSLILFIVAIWAIWYAVKSNQFEDLDNAPEQIILDDRQARRKSLANNPNNHVN